MDRSRYALLMLILLLLAGCRRGDARAPETPTPFSSIGLTPRAPAGEPIPISLANLADNPEFFEGANLQLHGQYQPLPRLICESEAFPSPATWGLVGEGLQANATGLDKQLRQLIARGQPITVEGRWLRYAGPVGCGKSASEKEIWYISVSRVVDPYPLARVTRLPDDIPQEETAIAEVPATEALPTEEEPPEVEETVTLEATAVTASATYVPSPLPPSGPPTEQPGGPSSPVPTPITATAVSSTVTPTGTVNGTPGGATATPTETPTPGPSPTSSNATINPKSEVDFEDLVMGNLGGNTIDSWTFSIDSSDSITITVAPASADILFSVLDANGQLVVASHDQAGAGEVETLKNLRLTEPGTYKVQIAADPAEQANYALMVLDSGSYNFTFMGNLSSGAQRSAALSPDNDHFWFYSATDGDTFSLQVTPNGEADAYVELYGPDGARLTTIDDDGSGEAEILDNYSVLATGMYAVRVGEFDFGEMSYQIVINKS